MYRQVLNAHALNNINRMPQIPDYHLMVGSAEELAPLPLLLYSTSTVPQAVVNNMVTYKEMDNGEEL